MTTGTVKDALRERAEQAFYYVSVVPRNLRYPELCSTSPDKFLKLLDGLTYRIPHHLIRYLHSDYAMYDLRHGVRIFAEEPDNPEDYVVGVISLAFCYEYMTRFLGFESEPQNLQYWNRSIEDYILYS